MEQDLCDVVYLDRRARTERQWTQENCPAECPPTSSARSMRSSATSTRTTLSPADEVEKNIRALLAVFTRVNVYQSCAPCIAAIERTCNDYSNRRCVMVLVSVPLGEEAHSKQGRGRTPSPRSGRRRSEHMAMHPENPYGMDFLVYLAYRIRHQNLGSRIIPVVIRGTDPEHEASPLASAPLSFTKSGTRDGGAMSQVVFFDAGAVDVLTGPLTVERTRCLPSHVYRVHAEHRQNQPSAAVPSRGKKTSWVGTKEGKPYTQIKEVMVCELMDHIINPDLEELPVDPSIIQIDEARADIVASAVGSWHFSAHDFTDDELLYGASLMLQHALSLPGLETWRLAQDELITFLLATRRVYNSSVLYHNFRHACDVLQATFCFLILIGSIPAFHHRSDGGTTAHARTHSTSIATLTSGTMQSALSNLIDPYHALVLLIAAIGHDVGHPGVNNGFLVMVNAPLAQLYNDRSVLESFHCAAYSQILRRYWKRAFEERLMRRLTITTILATDMGLHADYMAQMVGLQGRMPQDLAELNTWDHAVKERERELLLCLLIKCADICNVARRYDISAKWATLLIDEFYAQGQIEKDSNIPSALFGGPPDPKNMLQRAQSQIGFMTFFARPLFSGLSRLLPALEVAVQEMDLNQSKWQDMVDQVNGSRDAAAARTSLARKDHGCASTSPD